ncbi:hypothetical protein QWT69_02565 [Sporosarcina oncorhynchi]|uniref:Uncharacterized protein n=1 Tax=Sporosarcina oncorhynchi TaxID=3056444 RepID=A0ABZ0L715_9BACL|nr:hypothetical protein [Sporosarcina sp. T2O-4]WOV88022.1 hypothetical protein QWT69_02565 [Sporosarcina sp. T2O-4]
MEILEKKMIRMELQIGELIRIIANMNERIIELEENEQVNNRLSFFANRETNRL